MHDLQPPDDFRTISEFPQKEDLCGQVEMFLRSNLVNGKYKEYVFALTLSK